jgi:hypothetical protein
MEKYCRLITCNLFTLVLILLWPAGLTAKPGTPFYNVNDYGAKGDGQNMDSPGINKAIEAAALAGCTLCNWTANLKKEDWPTIVQIIEVTPNKKVVWALREWVNPDLGTASCIQLLDQKGKEENSDFMR